MRDDTVQNIDWEKLKEEAKLIEHSTVNSALFDSSTKNPVKNFDPGFKDKMLEVILQQILENPDMAKRFRKELTENKGCLQTMR